MVRFDATRLEREISGFSEPVKAVASLVLEAGGKVKFYHYRDGAIIPLDAPDLLSYSPSGLHTAFIAGRPDMVDWLFELLKRNWG